MSVLPPSFLPFWIEAEGESDLQGRRQWHALAFFLGSCAIAAFYASLYAPSDSGNWGWYPRLAKPAWAISPSLSGPISTIFYGVLAVSVWRIWRTGAFRTIPFTMAGFLWLLALQSLWSTLFYGLHSPLLGLADLLLILLLAAVLWLTYEPLDRIAGLLWLAYLAWTLCLLAVNGAIWWLNA